MDLFRTIWYDTVGEILVRANSAERPDPERIPGGEFFRGADLAELPEIAAIGNEWLEIEVRDTYRRGAGQRTRLAISCTVSRASHSPGSVPS